MNKTWLGIRIVVFLLLILMSIGLAPLGFYVMHEELFTGIFIVLASAFLGLAMLHTLKSVKLQNWDEPAMEIAENGFYDKRVFARMIPWDNLEWRFHMVKGNPSIALNILKNEKDYIVRAGFVDKFGFRMAHLFGFYKYHIDLMSLKTPYQEIRAEIEKYKASS